MSDGGKAALGLDPALIYSGGTFPIDFMVKPVSEKWPLYSCVIFHGAVVKVLFSLASFLT